MCGIDEGDPRHPPVVPAGRPGQWPMVKEGGWRLPELLMSELDSEPAPRLQRRTARDWLLDAGYATVSSLAGLASLAGYVFAHPPVPAGLLAVDAVGVALGCLAIFWWRRFPLPCAVGTALLVVVAPSIGVAAGFNATRTAVHRRFPVAASVAALLVACWLAVPLLYPIRPLPYWAHAVIVVVGVAALLAWGSFVRARRQLLQSLVERAHRAETEQQLRVAQAKQTEREHIAREMHDVLAHRLSLLSMHAGALDFRSDAGGDEVAASLRVIRSSAHQALQDLREVIGVLRAPSSANEDTPQPTLTSLPDLVAETSAGGSIVDFDQRIGDPTDVPQSVGRTAYRIIQEGLTNARKHASGSPVTLRVHGAPGDGLTVEIRNPVPTEAAATAVPGTGTGLIGLTERATLAGGRLRHGRTPGGEFSVVAWLPWPS